MAQAALIATTNETTNTPDTITNFTNSTDTTAITAQILELRRAVKERTAQLTLLTQRCGPYCSTTLHYNAILLCYSIVYSTHAAVRRLMWLRLAAAAAEERRRQR